MSDRLVLVQVGECPKCQARTEVCDGLEHYFCARDHDAAAYELVDTYAMGARESRQ